LLTSLDHAATGFTHNNHVLQIVAVTCPPLLLRMKRMETPPRLYSTVLALLWFTTIRDEELTLCWRIDIGSGYLADCESNRVLAFRFFECGFQAGGTFE